MQLPSGCLPAASLAGGVKAADDDCTLLAASSFLCSASPSVSSPCTATSSSNSKRASTCNTARGADCGNISSWESRSKASCGISNSSFSDKSGSMNKFPFSNVPVTTSCTFDIIRECSSEGSNHDISSSTSDSSGSVRHGGTDPHSCSDGGSSISRCDTSSNSESARGGDGNICSSSCGTSCKGHSSSNSTSGGKACKLASEKVEDVLATPLESAAAERVRQFLIKERMSNCRLLRVRKDYYSLTLEQRRLLLGAPTLYHLCKTVVMENTKHVGLDEKTNSKYYMVVLSYPRRLNGERVKDVIKAVNAKKNVKLGNKKLNFNFCRDGVRLTGFEYNAITPFGSLLPIPVVLDSEVAALQPPVIWLGGGEEHLKVMLPLSELQRVFDPIIGQVTFEDA